MSEEKTVVAILTLKKHQDGVWIKRLVLALEKIATEPTSAVALPKEIRVVALEDYLKGPLNISDGSSLNSNNWCCLVNRVSDAAEPWQVKACLAVLQLTKSVWKIPIVNGPDAYSFCTNKWCHHILFQQANLASPNTVAGMACTGTHQSALENKCLAMLYKLQDRKSSEPPLHDYLVKPNAGGFGAGIERHQAPVILPEPSDPNTTTNKSPDSLSEATNYSDKMVIFQQYVNARDDKTYRVWFLDGKVQCAVERSIDSLSSSQLSSSIASNAQREQQPLSTHNFTTEFTSGCAGGTCARPREPVKATSFQLWEVPDSVRREIEVQLLPRLPADAHCGSIEFLYSSSSEEFNKGENVRLYFDLNLLSTLPIIDTNTTAKNDNEDPWMQLAESIWNFTDCSCA